MIFHVKYVVDSKIEDVLRESFFDAKNILLSHLHK